MDSHQFSMPAGWVRRSLGEILQTPLSGQSVDANGAPAAGGGPAVLRLSAVVDGSFVPSENKAIPSGDLGRCRVAISADSILISRSNTLEMVGAVAYVDTDHPDLYIPDLLWLAKRRPESDCCLKWLAYVLTSRTYRKAIQRIASGTSESMKKITKPAFLAVHVACPPAAEQRQIAESISSWDQAIAVATALIGAKRTLRKALMQRLLDGKLRLSGPGGSHWQPVELRRFLVPRFRPVPRPGQPYAGLGVRSHGKGTFRKWIAVPEEVMMDTLYAVSKDDLVANITFAWEGAVAVADQSDEGLLVSHRFPTYEFNRDIMIPEFFGYLLQTRRFVHQLGLISPGGAGRNRVMSKTDFLALVVPIPTVDEQRRIADALLAADQEIALLEELLIALKAQRRSLIQGLATGLLRVRV